MYDIQDVKSDENLPLIVFATIKSWNLNNVSAFAEHWKSEYRVEVISDPEELTYENLKLMKPDWVFFHIGHG